MTIRLVKKPSPSRTTTGVLSIAFRKSSARASVSSEVASVRITSTSGIRSTGEKKCRPSMQDGSGTAAASSAIGMLDVLLAIGVPGRATRRGLRQHLALQIGPLEHRLDDDVAGGDPVIIRSRPDARHHIGDRSAQTATLAVALGARVRWRRRLLAATSSDMSIRSTCSPACAAT